MADSASESDSSSIDGPLMLPPSPVSREQLYKRIESLQQQNRVLKVELDTFKLRVKSLQEENRHLRQASVNIQAKAEQEEEYISNTLLKKIQALKKEKETLAHHYEQEEECLTNDLSRKLNQLRQEKCKLEQTLEQEQECLVNKLMRKIEKLEAETNAKQNNLDQLRREKVELENTLEQEQEALVNRLWKRMDKLEAEKRNLQSKIELGQSNEDQSSSSSTASLPPTGAGGGGNNSPSSGASLPGPAAVGGEQFLRLRLQNIQNNSGNLDNCNPRGLMGPGRHNPAAYSPEDVITLSSNVQHLRNEVDRLKGQLNIAQQQHSDKMNQFAMEERQIREENLRLQRRLQLEMDRRESLCRHLSESESSLEMEDERHFHESLAAHGSHSNSILSSGGGNNNNISSSGGLGISLPQGRTGRHGGSSPGPGTFVPSPGSRPISPGSSCSRDIMMSPPSPVNRCHLCNGHGWVGPIVGGGGGGGMTGNTTPLVVTTTSGQQLSHIMVSSSSPPIRHSSRERFARPAPPLTSDARTSQEPRTPGDSTMTSPAPSPAPLEIVMSPAAPAVPSPSPMDTTSSSNASTKA